MAAFPTLETNRLILREVVEADAAALLAIHSDAEHMRWYDTWPITDLEIAKVLVMMFAALRDQPKPGVRWAIELKAQPGLVGTCGFFNWDRETKHCLAGYEMSRHHVGKGLMREALAEVFAWGWEHMELNRIEAHIHPENAPSRALIERLGFVQQGLLRDGGFADGKHHDMIQYATLKPDGLREVRSPSVR
jgi:[ribosomal protein S5]-alanine N-acetyltransferase